MWPVCGRMYAYLLIDTPSMSCNWQESESTSYKNQPTQATCIDETKVAQFLAPGMSQEM